MGLRRVLGIGGILIGAGLAWRYASQQRQLPCPSWLSWSLTNPVTDWLWGTRVTLDRIGLEPGQRVLEVGPGPGRLLIPAAQRVLPGGEVVGLDIQPEMIERLRERAEREGIGNLTAVAGDITSDVSLPPESFDIVFLCAVLGEIPQPAAAITQCARLLRPGGRLSITEILPDPHYQSQETVSDLATGAGLEVEEIQGTALRYTANFRKR